MITVHGRKTSSNVQAVMWTVAELGLEHRRLDVGGTFGGTDTAEFRAISPLGLVPAIEDGALSIFETGAIVRYLGARYGDEGFWPADPAARARLDQWAEWAKTNLVPAFIMRVFWQLVRMREHERDEAVLAEGLATTGRLMQIADARLGGDAHFGGDRLCFADIMVGHLLYRYFDLPIERPDTPRLAAYYERLTARPAYAEHVMVSYDSLRPA